MIHDLGIEVYTLNNNGPHESYIYLILYMRFTFLSTSISFGGRYYIVIIYYNLTYTYMHVRVCDGVTYTMVPRRDHRDYSHLHICVLYVCVRV